MEFHGLVIKNTGSWYTVKTDGGDIIDCKIKGAFRLKGIRTTNPVAVGDYVRLMTNREGTAFIFSIDERKNHIVRRASNLSKQSQIIAANLDQALLLVTVNYPLTTTTFMDRFLACGEAYDVPVVLVFNKIDLLNEEELQAQRKLISLYSGIGYVCKEISAGTGEGVDDLRQLVEGKVSLLSGHSGVGKSTLINRLIPDVKLRTAKISPAHNTGMHTTTFSEMIEMPEGGYLIDTPGIKGFGFFDIEPAEMTSYFREFFEISKECQFNDCTHIHEPGCAVLKALEEKRIALSRYQSYLSMLQDKDQGKYREPY